MPTGMTTNLQNKTLIANWVEERQCAHLEEGIRRPDGTLSPALHQQGHRGILSTGEGQETTSTAKDSYTPPQPCSVRTLGKREEALRRQVYQVVSQQVHEELHPPPPPPDWSSTTRKDFSREFSPTRPPPTMPHDVNSEHPVTYWTENRQQVTGMTQVQQSQSPFARNAAFSTPIEEYRDQPLPHNLPP